MILIAGGTGRMGQQVISRLAGRGLAVRILTRDPARAQPLRSRFPELVEIALGDVRDAATVERAAAGAHTVVSAMHGFAGAGVSPRTVDWQGNRNLIQAAGRGGAEHFILLSILQAGPDHPIELFRMKYRAEQDLRASPLAWTIIRPSAFMELWAEIIGAPLIKTGRTRLFGRGHNPINFVSATDVARFVELAVVDPALRGAVVEIGGPENITFRQFAQTFQAASGNAGSVSQVPLPMLRLMSVLMRPVNPSLARQIQASIVMDTRDMTFDASELLRRYPSISLSSLAEVVKRDYAAGP